MRKWKEIITGCWTGVYEKDVDKTHVEFLGLREKRSSTDFCESLEDGDRIYLYHQNKRVLNGRFVRPGTSVTDVCLIVPEDKRKGNPEMVLSYDNLKLFFRSNFRVDVYRPFEKSPYAYYPRKLNGVETPLVPY